MESNQVSASFIIPPYDGGRDQWGNPQNESVGGDITVCRDSQLVMGRVQLSMSWQKGSGKGDPIQGNVWLDREEAIQLASAIMQTVVELGE